MSDTSSGRGLFTSLRQLLSTSLELVQVRLALLGNEIEQEKLRVLDAVLWVGLGLLLLGMGLMLTCGFIVVLLWESHRLLTLGLMSLLFLGAAVWVIWMARQRLQSPGGLFNASLSELARDRAGLDTPDRGPT